MNFLKILPKGLRKSFEKNALGAGIANPEKYYSKSFVITLLVSLVLGLGFYFLKQNPLYVFLGFFIFLQLIVFFRVSLKASSRVKRMEEIFPDVIQLMSSNLRAGMTIDRSFLLSARPEFYPLDQEILKTGKEIATGKDIASALLEMSKRTGSDKISKTIRLIISGLKAGGNISTLLDQTASNMREKEFIEKRAASNILMYVIFIFFAVAIGAPLLFGLSSVLVEVIIKISSTIPVTDSNQVNLPISFTSIGLTSQFIVYFSLFFLLVTNIISSLVLGLVNKGEEKQGLKYIIPLMVLSVIIFFLVRIVLGGFFSDIIPG